MNSDVVTHGTAEQFVEVNQSSRHQRSTVLRGKHHQIGVDLLSGKANPFTDIGVSHMQRLELNTQISGSLHSAVQVGVALACCSS